LCQSLFGNCEARPPREGDQPMRKPRPAETGIDTANGSVATRQSIFSQGKNCAMVRKFRGASRGIHDSVKPRKANIMKVKDVMTKEVRICGINDNLSVAAQTMWMRDCGILPIVNNEGIVVGVLTDRDICMA